MHHSPSGWFHIPTQNQYRPGRVLVEKDVDDENVASEDNEASDEGEEYEDAMSVNDDVIANDAPRANKTNK